MEKTSFRKLLALAWRASFAHPLPWIFGAFIALAAVIENSVVADQAAASSIRELLGSIASDPRDIYYWATLAAALIAVRVFGKGNLIAALSLLFKKNAAPVTVSFQPMAQNFLRTLLLEAAAGIFLIAIAAILSLPSLIAFKYNQEAFDTVLFLSVLTFLPIAIAVFFISEFALFYRLLSRLTLRSAFENGGALFSRHAMRSLLFGIFSLALAAVFTFCLNLVMLSIAVLSQKAGVPFLETALSFLGSFVAIAWFAVLRQALWLSFFKDIASPKEPEKKEAAALKESIPEIPPA